jgi:hypothetical protein
MDNFVTHTKGNFVERKFKKIGEEVKAEFASETADHTPTHAKACGAVGATGKHGHLGSNAAKQESSEQTGRTAPYGRGYPWESKIARHDEYDDFDLVTHTKAGKK